MGRYIDADKFRRELHKTIALKGGISERLINSVIYNQPTADVVEVVRCRDCKHNHCELVAGEECWLCGLGHEGHKSDRQDFYCSDGERVDK